MLHSSLGAVCHQEFFEGSDEISGDLELFGGTGGKVSLEIDVGGVELSG